MTAWGRIARAWALAAAMGLLALASLTGDGNGLPGSGFGRSPAWPWVVLLAGTLILFVVLLSSGPAPGPTGDEP